MKLDSGTFRRAIDSFIEAQRLMRETFGVMTASEVVSEVLQGRAERNGRCHNGYEYMVHGVGYTVVFPSGAQAHIDSCGEGRDCFRIYDIQFFLEDLVGKEFPLEAVAAACNEYAKSGRLRKVDDTTFEIVDGELPGGYGCRTCR